MITVTLTQQQKNRLLLLLSAEIFRNTEFLRLEISDALRHAIEGRTDECCELVKLLKG